jgi:hypothetical protein
MARQATKAADQSVRFRVCLARTISSAFLRVRPGFFCISPLGRPSWLRGRVVDGPLEFELPLLGDPEHVVAVGNPRLGIAATPLVGQPADVGLASGADPGLLGVGKQPLGLLLGELVQIAPGVFPLEKRAVCALRARRGLEGAHDGEPLPAPVRHSPSIYSLGLRPGMPQFRRVLLDRVHLHLGGGGFSLL